MEERKSERRERHCCFISASSSSSSYCFLYKGESLYLSVYDCVCVCVHHGVWVSAYDWTEWWVMWLCRWWFVMYLLCVSCVVLPTWSGHALLWWDVMVIIIIVVAVSLPSRQNNSRICPEGSALTVLVCECVCMRVGVSVMCMGDVIVIVTMLMVCVLCLCVYVWSCGYVCAMCDRSCHHHAWCRSLYALLTYIHTHTTHSTRDTWTHGTLYNSMMIMNTKHITCICTACTTSYAAQCTAMHCCQTTVLLDTQQTTTTRTVL